MQLLNLSDVTRLTIMLLACVGLMACDGGTTTSNQQSFSSTIISSSSEEGVDGTHSSVQLECSYPDVIMDDGLCGHIDVQKCPLSYKENTPEGIFCLSYEEGDDTSSISQGSSSVSPRLCEGISDVIEIDGQCVSLYCEATGGVVSHPDACGSASSYSSSHDTSSIPVACAGSAGNPVFASFYGLCKDIWGISLEEFCAYAPLASECIPSSSSSGTQCPTGQTMDQYGTCGYFENDCLSRNKQSAQCLAQCQSDPSSDSACKAVLAGKHSRCTVDYNAMGNGSWQACYTLEDGTAECLHKDSGTQVTQVKWDDGTAVTNAAQITGAGYYEVILVTTEGAVHYGSRSRLSKNAPLFAAGGISATGGQNTLCAIVMDDGRKDVQCWGKDKDPSRPELPLDFNAKQLSANYSDVCALNNNGEAWCWQQKADNSLDFIQSSPAKAPFSEAITHVSVGQLVVCGVKASGGLECLARWSDAGYLPTKGGDTQVAVAQTGMEDVVAFQGGFGQGISIHANGKAKLWKGGQAMEFDGINNAIAGGGDRGLACVLTTDSDVYCLDNHMKPVKVNGDKAAKHGVCPL